MMENENIDMEEIKRTILKELYRQMFRLILIGVAVEIILITIYKVLEVVVWMMLFFTV